MSHPSQQLLGLGARPLKSLSQNFLTSPHWAERLTSEAMAFEADELWEIGPGLGALTNLLVQKSPRPIRLFEFDKKLGESLAQRFPTIPIEQGDVLTKDFDALSSGKRIAVLSNLPYHLSSPILFKFLESRNVAWQGFVLTFQREFAERLISGHGTSQKSAHYGALSVVFQWYFRFRKLGILPGAAFFPAPKVESMALAFWPSGLAPNPTHVAVVKTAFRYRRKTLWNCLRDSVPLEVLKGALEARGFTPQNRPEDLPPDAYHALATQLEPWFSKPASSGKHKDLLRLN